MDAQREPIVAAHRGAVAFYRAQLRGSPARAYLLRRLGELPRGWPVGYAPAGGSALLRYLRRRGFGGQDLVDAGLALRLAGGRIIDRFRNRIMVPVFDMDGDPVGFLGRSCPPREAGPKYLNTPGTVAYVKGRLLFGLWEQRRAWAAGARPVLVEGPMDVLAVAVADAERGEFAAVATCGTAVTPAHLQCLAAVGVLRRGLVSAMDGDRAGRRATGTVWQLLQHYPGAAGAATAAVFPAGADPATVAGTDGPDALRRALTGGAVPLVDAVIETMLATRDGSEMARASLDDRLAVLHRAAAAVAVTGRSEDVARVAGYLSGRLDLGQATVTGAIVDAISPPAAA